MKWFKVKYTKKQIWKFLGIFTFYTILIFIFLTLTFTCLKFISQTNLYLNKSKEEGLSNFAGVLTNILKNYWFYLIGGSAFGEICILIYKKSKKKDKKYEKDLDKNNSWTYNEIENLGNYSEFRKNYELNNLDPAWVVSYSKTKNKIKWNGVNLSKFPLNLKILGGTRSGKTQKFVIPILKYNLNIEDKNKKPNFVVADPKGELYSAVYEDLQNNNYRAVVLDIADPITSQGFNLLNNIWDTFHSKKGNVDNNKTLAYSMLSEVIYSLSWGESKEPIWTTNAKKILIAIGKMLLLYSTLQPNKITRDQFNLANFTQFLSVSEIKNSRWIKKLDELEKTSSNNLLKDNEFDINKKQRQDNINELLQLYREEIKPFSETADQTLSGFLTNAKGAIGIFAEDKSIRSFSSRSETDIKELIYLSDPNYKNSQHWNLQVKDFYEQIDFYKDQNKDLENKLKFNESFNEIILEYAKYYSYSKEVERMIKNNSNDFFDIDNKKQIIDKAYIAIKTYYEENFNEDSNITTFQSFLDLLNQHHLNTLSITRLNQKIDLYNEECKPFAVFIKFPDHEKSKNTIVNLIVDQIYKIAITIANDNGGQLARHLLNIFDEFGNLPTINDFGSKLSIALSRKVMFLIILQSYSQLDKYGKDNKNIILENTGLTAFINSDSDETLKEIVNTLGKKDILKSSFSKNKNDSENESVSKAEKEIMSIADLKALDSNTHIIFRMQSKPLKLKSSLAYNFWKLKSPKEPIYKDAKDFELSEYIINFNQPNFSFIEQDTKSQTKINEQFKQKLKDLKQVKELKNDLRKELILERDAKYKDLYMRAKGLKNQIEQRKEYLSNLTDPNLLEDIKTEINSLQEKLNEITPYLKEFKDKWMKVFNDEKIFE
ncbi:type IV secretion system protein VirD4 [Mycoplasmopsis columboralis]|uniref:Type IV secretion system protein VirD4 n=1 Tax=Mycoplasmopsis columboralis TaxID=171282 RepID=A0A449B5L3_9BACT|nr:type IV secretory system conjugative DNA transfer family protein [Mycoplasmopsis columboralis]VEU75859.1 type IV secretion system protein VirD4 [Mycoplasmopsis columboralis]